MIVSRLAHVALSVPDLDAAASFYSDVFGLAVVAQEPGARFLATGRSNTFELALVEGEPALDHFAFSACGPDALGQARDRLGAAGIFTADVEPGPGLADGFSFALPTGHAMELVLEADPAPFVVAAAAGARHHRGAGPAPLEHITLHAYDIRANAELLCEQLGFRISESIRPANAPRWRNTFLRAGQMHHDLGMIPTDEDRPGLHHFCFEVPSVADLVRMSDSLASRGIQLDSSVGRHVSGNNVFLYFKDPWGTRLEVNTDMARVDAAAPPLVRDAPAPFDAWRPGRPPALDGGTLARDARIAAGH